MAGVSISVLGLDADWLRWLDAPTSASAWSNQPKQRSTRTEVQMAPKPIKSLTPSMLQDVKTDIGRAVKRAIGAACDALIAAEGELTEMDRIVGDGDLGTGMKRAASAVKEAVDTYPLDDVPATLKTLGHTHRQEPRDHTDPLRCLPTQRTAHQ